MEYFAAIDVSLKLSCVCVVDGTGQILREAKVASEPVALVAYLRETGPSSAGAARPKPPPEAGKGIDARPLGSAVRPRGPVTGTRDRVKPQHRTSVIPNGMDHVLQIGSPAPSDSILCAAAAPTTDRSQTPVTRHRRMSLTLDAPLQKAGAVDQQVDGLTVPARLWRRHLQRPGPAAQGGVVGHRQSQPEQVNDGANQPLRLA